jgi:hypothetical protein
LGGGHCAMRTFAVLVRSGSVSTDTSVAYLKATKSVYASRFHAE